MGEFGNTVFQGIPIMQKRCLAVLAGGKNARNFPENQATVSADIDMLFSRGQARVSCLHFSQPRPPLRARRQNTER